jgi:hypothetical protein
VAKGVDDSALRAREHRYYYPREVKEKYRKENLFDKWFEKYEGRWPFHESLWNNNQIPHSRRDPMYKVCLGFNELFMATQYLDVNPDYEALLLYRPNDAGSNDSYNEAVRLLGDAHELMLPKTQEGGRPPDLLLFHRPSRRFRFVECKGPSETYTEKQPDRFSDIEDWLNESPPPCKEPLSDPKRPDLFPPLVPGQWFHVVRLHPR